MVFTSAIFLFAFLPAALLAFYLFPPRWRTAPLLVMSAVFYAWGEPILVVLILLTGLFTFWCGGGSSVNRSTAGEKPCWSSA